MRGTAAGITPAPSLCLAGSVTAHETARLLLEIGAVNMSHETPFVLTSGKLSPVYIDLWPSRT